MKKPFSMAVLLSIMWHLTLGSLFTIVITPAKLGASAFGGINFVGPLLLEDVAKTVVAAKKPFLMSVHSERFSKRLEALEARVPKLERVRLVEKVKISAKTWNIGMIDSMAAGKLTPAAVLEKENADYEPIPSQIKGPVAAREVTFKPELPPLVRWPTKMEHDLDVDNFEIELKFWVNKDGSVEFMEKLSSCGYPQIDIMAMRYMNMWRFAPLLPGKFTGSQWGRLRLNFRQLQ